MIMALDGHFSDVAAVRLDLLVGASEYETCQTLENQYVMNSGINWRGHTKKYTAIGAKCISTM